ncbi:uncharacterized protein BHQ10_004931 [Talaromyces amestolkiae]|uniref:Rhodopsin domain-containing protein n=1 Tax=Talaromyces amestolkiae TaxID=1196081 RepID=A0A364KZE8_TALAM|nr:uncharacterized protein BHQ10_004931 [Talaromyces amestolkiae]RAO68919.1 hypothetical protein BHQ10_004931 [Talaromyces amestolkiae]
MVVLRETGRLTVRLTIAMSALAILAVVVRLIARNKVKLTFNLDDVFILLGLLFFLGVEARIYTSGGTLDESQMNLNELINLFKYIYALESFVTTSITAIKISILLMYRRIFPIAEFQRYALVVGVLAAWQLDLLMDGQATCLTYGHFIIGYEISNMLLDIAILMLPIRVLRTLQLSMTKKVVVGAIFILGGFIVVVCIIRTVYLSNATLENPVALYNGLNWTSVELAVAVLCACIPTYGPLLPTQRAVRALSSWGSHNKSRAGNRMFKSFGYERQSDNNELEHLSEPSTQA